MATCPRDTHTHSHTNKPPTAGVRLVTNISIKSMCNVCTFSSFVAVSLCGLAVHAETFPSSELCPILPDLAGFHVCSDCVFPSQPKAFPLHLHFDNCSDVFRFISSFHVPEPFQPSHDHHSQLHPCSLPDLFISSRLWHCCHSLFTFYRRWPCFAVVKQCRSNHLLFIFYWHWPWPRFAEVKQCRSNHSLFIFYWRCPCFAARWSNAGRTNGKIRWGFHTIWTLGGVDVCTCYASRFVKSVQWFDCWSSLYVSAGTTERVCLITGSLESVKQVYLYVMDKVRGKPEGQQPVDTEMKVRGSAKKKIKKIRDYYGITRNFLLLLENRPKIAVNPC